jgi:antitoxin CptB
MTKVGLAVKRAAMPDLAPRLARARFRAWHRGTREADYMIGGFFDRYHAGWGEPELAWFEALLEEDDVDVMAWALGAQAVPEEFAGAQMSAMQKLDYVSIT